ncbi:MAG: molybdenum cofactor guanylyltransferase [Meiothermus sp.]|uniref:molybdenum cofactor guanylyltransferase n=1 Tax=Meiothermus sp. TaxID=1955249 RepID=UPI002600ACB5|nr:molybdenum cofactor guanylyltransferase [Meiothermus sp.]MCS7069449.1 molybdenum cofactor guanylyltransferase [Meiothermus sp.]MCX7601282.1 molybdenum cofactor guanylyltransferase [Meiothermus sp.]MDW8424864.1 molybdenum cofactor guanylyltransferase [Meiothermus sp.]
MLRAVRWSGAVLAGGWSRRFGQDKALYLYRGKPLMAWVLDSLAEASERFVVSNHPYQGLGLRYHDLKPGGDTLSGLHSALAHARQDWVAVAACDQPFLSREYWGYLLGLVRPDVQAVVAVSQDFFEPLGALYHRSLEPEVLQRLEAGELRMQALLRSIPHVALDRAELEARFGPHLFVNANRPEDLPL